MEFEGACGVSAGRRGQIHHSIERLRMSLALQETNFEYIAPKQGSLLHHPLVLINSIPRPSAFTKRQFHKDGLCAKLPDCFSKLRTVANVPTPLKHQSSNNAVRKYVYPVRSHRTNR